MDKPKFDTTLQKLTPTEEKIAKLFLTGQSDNEIAKQLICTKETIRTHLSNIFKKFELCDKRDNREQLKCLFIKYKPEWIPPDNEEPNGIVPLNSNFYVSQDDLISKCSQEIQRSGALIRIKAPQLMGKSSLVTRILHDAENRLKYSIVEINFTSADRQLLDDSERFFKWLCIIIGNKLQLTKQLDKYWDNSLGGNILNCTEYFEKYLLPQLESPLVLALDKVDRLFPYHVADDFFPLLRIFHENAKLEKREIWQKLRLIIVHSTEVYVKLKAENSPFGNVGYDVELRDFTSEEVKMLFIRHQLSYQNFEVEKLMQLVGGHPYLIRLALYHLKTTSQTLEQLLKKATTAAGIYQYHLRQILTKLRENQRLETAYKEVIKNAPNPVHLDPMDIFLLDSLGLVIKGGNTVKTRYNLYQQYFLGVL